MFKTRLVSGIVLVALALAFILAGGNVLLAALFVVSIIGMFELYRILKIEKNVAGIAGYLAAAVFYANLYHPFLPDMMIFAIGSLVLLMFVYVFTYPKYQTEQIFAAYFGIFYVAVMISYIYQARMLARGSYIVWLIFLCSWDVIPVRIV